MRLAGWWLGSMLLLGACGDDREGGGFPAGGGALAGAGFGGGAGASGGASGNAGGGAAGGDAEECVALKATVRDFKVSHPDFEDFGGDEVQTGIVRNELGSDHKPVYAAAGPTQDTAGPEPFAQWYRDVDGINQPFAIEIPLSERSPGLFVYDNSQFFPVDGRGFGNEGNAHNYHFTTEVHTRFTYRGREQFTFTGDDDLWLFVNGKLAIDLGGLHRPKSATIDFDARAAELGLSVGKTYAMDIFHAERHTVESNFRIETSIECFAPPTILF
jgi:fibro-slime domain-containing protein